MKTKLKLPRSVFITALIFCVFHLSSYSQENEENYRLKILKFPSPPKIDGKLENPLWDNGAVGDAIYYDDSYLGYLNSIGLELTLKPLTNLHLYYELNNDAFYKKRAEKKNTMSTSSANGSTIKCPAPYLCALSPIIMTMMMSSTTVFS